MLTTGAGWRACAWMAATALTLVALIAAVQAVQNVPAASASTPAAPVAVTANGAVRGLADTDANPHGTVDEFLGLGTAFATGDFNRVPIINGTNHDEWRLFVALSELAGNPTAHNCAFWAALEAA